MKIPKSEAPSEFRMSRVVYNDMNIVIPILAYRNPVFLITRLAVDIYYNVRYYVLMLLFVTISVSISIFLTIAVFAILAVFAITIVVTIFALIHINTVDQGTEIR